MKSEEEKNELSEFDHNEIRNDRNRRNFYIYG